MPILSNAPAPHAFTPTAPSMGWYSPYHYGTECSPKGAVVTQTVPSADEPTVVRGSGIASVMGIWCLLLYGTWPSIYATNNNLLVNIKTPWKALAASFRGTGHMWKLHCPKAV